MDISEMHKQIAENEIKVYLAAASKCAPYIGENGNWYVWNLDAGGHIDTGLKAKGESGITVIDGKVYVVDDNVKIELVQAYHTYGVSIDLTNSNPETAVTYTDDAVGMVAGSSDWYKMNIFRNIKPCLLKNGTVVGYLNRDNFTQFEDGMAADITSGNSGDVMIEIPKTGYKIAKSGTTLTVQVTDEPNKEGFSYKAHTRSENGDRDKLYIGAFLGSYVSGKLRSLSGKSPHAKATLSEFRDLANVNGEGYDLFAFYPLTLLQCLYLIMYKNLNSQEALGRGHTDDKRDEQDKYQYDVRKTGATVAKGMSYGSAEGSEQMKFLGIEDFWGNIYQYIDGLVSDYYYQAWVATDNFNDTGEGYTNIGQMARGVVSGYMKAPKGNNAAGFIIDAAGGSDSTYFSDFAYFYLERLPLFGGLFDLGSQAGVFHLKVYAKPTDTSRVVGGRLMFL